MTHTFKDSTAIQRVEYYREDGTLLVMFTSQSTYYTYCHVPSALFAGLLKANSAGAYLADNIGHQYDTATLGPDGWTC
jgi:KTSC domain